MRYLAIAGSHLLVRLAVFVIISAAMLAAVGTYCFVMQVAGKHDLLGLATLIAGMAFVPLAARCAWSGADYDLFYLVWQLSLCICAVIALIRRAQKYRL